MELSKLELKILEQLAQGTNNIQQITKNLKRHNSRIYRTKQDLIKKDLIQFRKGILEPKKHTYIVLLLQLISQYPNLIPLLSDSGIPVLTTLLSYNTVEEIQEHSDFKKSMIYRKIQQAIRISVVTQTNKKKYILNKKIWNELIEFLKELKKHEETIDPRIPINSKIYHKTSKEIIFSNKNLLQASLTGFSAYNQYGIKLLLPTNYYYLPKKTLTKMDMIMHSLYIVQKETDRRNLTYIGLFYCKYKDELKIIKHPIIKKIKRVLKGEKIIGYPTIEELKEKAELYDIRL